ncbi:hypothetical protein DDB_G0280597 [Dictyostelium discoideum AX4]|uniref:Putative uncharacterized protein DDB_G0280597 n=1 Tax=Dictyostelium discoideum TaxID=44689 RepID=Y6065_DICDI|nr:hypothetical protein DDB_G0280597 [Dictyostelium discoideum AX4]Q54V60.1 RecName: Full=Putative uncharacterized protein DDB_G0280597 [Dictyostelium discoideum]EAL67100.1 hypothetical protein DDB_G0280597 [Dictyostelium discoideum AX4]|eukprot:XP_641071.1 hypothetical protein DDB_G0280597 [Dictyostelium discoideum AX4]
MNRFRVATDQLDLYKASLMNRAFSSNQNSRNNGKYFLQQLTQFQSTEIKGEGSVIRNLDN